MTGFYDDGGDHLIVYAVLVWFTTLTGAAASMIILYLINIAESDKGESCHSFLIKCMSYGQLAYDLSFAPSAIDYGRGVFIFFNLFQIIGGISVAIISNVMTIVVLGVLLWRKYLDVLSHKWAILVSILLPCIIVGIFFLYAEFGNDNEFLDTQQDIYFWMRLASIGINFVVCLMAKVFVLQLNRYPTNNESVSTQAVSTLVSRLLWYPVIQAISRSGLTVYELVYGWDFNPDEPSKGQFAWQIIYTVITPMASVGYLCIYLTLQPMSEKQKIGHIFGFSTGGSSGLLFDEYRNWRTSSEYGDAKSTCSTAYSVYNKQMLLEPIVDKDYVGNNNNNNSHDYYYSGSGHSYQQDEFDDDQLRRLISGSDQSSVNLPINS